MEVSGLAENKLSCSLTMRWTTKKSKCSCRCWNWKVTFSSYSKYVTAEVKEVEIELAASLWWPCSTGTINHLLKEIVKKGWKSNYELYVLSQIWIWYIFRQDLVYLLCEELATANLAVLFSLHFYDLWYVLSTLGRYSL